MAFRKSKDSVQRFLNPVLPGASTVLGQITSTCLGHLCMASSNNGLLPVGTTADFAQAAGILGIIAAVPADTTPGSTVPFYVMPILPGEEIVADFSTTFSTALPATTDLGKYLGFSNTTTFAGAIALDMDTLSNVRGSTSASFFKITGIDVARREVRGTINSTHLAY